MARAVLPVLAAALALLASFAEGADGKAKTKGSPQAAKDLRAALQMISAGQLEPGIEKLRAVVKGFPGDPAAAEAAKQLRENGVGEEVRVHLLEREVFRAKLKIPEGTILEMSESILKELRGQYKVAEPFFKKGRLEMRFYDGQARYVKSGGSTTSSGHFSFVKADRKAGVLEGKIEWYFPREASTPKDRQLYMQSHLYHETTHYLSALGFGGALPSIFDEGIATWFTSRLQTEHYQHFRTTERERVEKNARQALNTIAKQDDFLKMLDSSRGFGQGNVMISRWYGLCYAIVDFIAEAEIDGKKAGMTAFLSSLGTAIRAELDEAKEADRAPELGMKKVLAGLVEEFYGVGLDRFHKELVKRIQTSYRM